MTRIALDVMGGDRAPDAVLAGATRACSGGADGLAPDRILLVGDREILSERLEALGGNPGFEILHASEVIGMDEKPAQALRAKRDSSISVGIGAVKKGAAGAFVSMGNTGAVVGAATLGLKTLEGVNRPGIAVTMSLTGSPLTIMDMGANIAARPEHLQQYAVMGATYQRDILGVSNPRIGLLNIGEESSKGTDLLQGAHLALSSGPLNFVGNVEGSDLFRGACDVVITDGFTGNVVLKLMEGMAGFMLELFLNNLGQCGLEVPPEAIAGIQRQIDYSEYGGALLMGVQGVVVIGHGRSDDRAVANALGQAAQALDSDVNEGIVRGIGVAGSTAQ